ncbi:hypothetical protein DFJ73DRAFT_797021 [Zopfochytrium polystomum]|nr:hypothetical protein DFJ73DRAFT_797021 [Zopfochytrium polystomum]
MDLPHASVVPPPPAVSADRATPPQSSLQSPLPIAAGIPLKSATASAPAVAASLAPAKPSASYADNAQSVRDGLAKPSVSSPKSDRAEHAAVAPPQPAPQPDPAAVGDATTTTPTSENFTVSAATAPAPDRAHATVPENGNQGAADTERASSSPDAVQAGPRRSPPPAYEEFGRSAGSDGGGASASGTGVVLGRAGAGTSQATPPPPLPAPSARHPQLASTGNPAWTASQASHASLASAVPSTTTSSSSSSDHRSSAANTLSQSLSPRLRAISEFVVSDHSDESDASVLALTTIEGAQGEAQRAPRTPADAAATVAAASALAPPRRQAPIAQLSAAEQQQVNLRLERMVAAARLRDGGLYRLSAIPLEYENRPLYFSSVLPEELEGILPNTVFAARIAALNKELVDDYKHLLDRGPVLRTVAMFASTGAGVMAMIIVPTTLAVGMTVVGLAIVGTVLFFVLAFAVTSLFFIYLPRYTVESAVTAWTREDEPRRLRWSSVRHDVPMKRPTFRPVAVPWEIVVERVREPLLDPASAASVAAGDALPEYRSPQPSASAPAAAPAAAASLSPADPAANSAADPIDVRRPPPQEPGSVVVVVEGGGADRAQENAPPPVYVA